MRRNVLLTSMLVFAFSMTACSQKSVVQQQTNESPNPSESPQAQVAGIRFAPPPGVPSPPDVGGIVNVAGPGILGPAPGPENETERQEKYDAALHKAMGLLAANKYEDALLALETARSLRDTEIVKLALERTKQKLEQETAAERTATDIQAVLEDGRADEAAKLATEALRQFGDTASADILARLKRQANALVAVQTTDPKERLQRFRTEYETAKSENNLRAAALALENAVQLSPDDSSKKQLDELRDTLARFDDLRSQAAELRKDPATLDEAIAKLQEAAKLWDTLPIRQEIDDYALALQSRRERLAIAEFEVRGEIGIPQAGRFVADELLGAFQARYDLVESSQIARIMDDLKLSNTGVVDDDLARREIGKAAKARFLVIGSITPVSGITVQARLVDTETGLIVQTGRVVAADQADLLRQLPQLGRILQMSDDDKRTFEEQQTKDAAPVQALKPPADEQIPPAPELPEIDARLPAPLIPAQLTAPTFTNLKPEQFDQLPPPPAVGQLAILPVLPAARDREIRQRSLFVALELGDDLFRRRRFREALFHFEFCLNIFPEHRHVRLRVERCQALLPPVVFVPVTLQRPRLALLDFLVVGDPGVVPPYLGWWTAEHIIPYMGPQYDVVSRAELFWWMSRLGITPRDVLFDPAARLYLGRALNVRYFLIGHLVQTASFDVTTYLLDAQFGYLASSARIHVRTPQELKLRLPELAWLTKLDPAERLRMEQDNLSWNKMLVEIRLYRERREYRLGIDIARRALKQRPNQVEVLVLLQQMEQQHRLAELATVRMNEQAQRQVAMRDWHSRQLALTRATEAARWQAEQQSLLRADADRRRWQAQREQAFLTVTVQARAAVQKQQFQNGVLFFESALALRPNDEPTLRELALARARAEEAARANALAAAAVRERTLREQRERELAAVAVQLANERRVRAEAEAAQRRLRTERDQREYQRLLEQAQQLSAQQRYSQAVAAAQAAKKINATAEAERLLSQLLIELARANAEKRGAAEKAELERQLADERQRRIEAERNANDKQRTYEVLLAEAQRLLQQEQFESALAKFTAARTLHSTDVALTGLRQAQVGLQAKKNREAALARENERLRLQNDLLKKHLADAQVALADKQFERSIQLFQEAKKIDPKNEVILVGLTKAEKAREQELFSQRRRGDEQLKKATFQKLLESGKVNLRARKYDAAVLALAEALRLFPNDEDAKAAHAEALAKLEGDANAKAGVQRKAAEYQKLMADGRRAQSAKQYDKALEAFRAAQRLLPGDQAAAQFAQDALAAKNRAELANMLTRFRAALAAGNLEDAAAVYRLAAALDANDEGVKKALADIRRAQDAKQSSELAMKKRDEEVAALLAKARTAFVAKQFVEATQFAEQAVQLQPTSKSARDLLAQATKARDEVQRTANAAEMQSKIKALVAAAESAIAQKKLADAEKLLADAARLAPNDAGLVKARAALRQAQQAMAAGDAEVLRKKQAYDAAMAAGRSSLVAKRYDEALKSVVAALQHAPNDKAALALRTQIEDARRSAAGMETKREFGRIMLQARTSFAAKKYDEALKIVQNALTLIPADADALRLQAEIRKAKDTPPMPPPPKQPPALYTKQMEAGATLEAKQQYAQALTAYQAALRSLPGDERASKKVDFCQSMSAGQRALQAKKFAAAVKEFEEALRVFPNDANAKQLLQQAKKAK